MSAHESPPMKANIPALAVMLGLISGCTGRVIDESQPPRPVTYATLKVMNPGAVNRLTGTAESWKREEIAFEVPGRVRRIVEPGADIVGRTFDEEGNPLTEGTLLAELDDERYLIALEQAKAGAAATRTELEQVIPQQLKEAQANQGLQQKELDRNLAMRAENPGATSQATIDRFDAALKGATAQVAKVEAVRAAKAAELNSYLAQIDQAERNIRDCKLVSPFTGQIARVHVIPGGYAFRGIPVVTVQMMDPMKVNIAVSPETDERINFNDIIPVYTQDGEKLDGYVYLKDTFADPTTRTFLVTLLVRNHQLEKGVPEDLTDDSVPRCRNLWPLQLAEGKESGNYYVAVNAIQQDDQGHFVWVAENLTLDQMETEFSPVVTARKARITLGNGRQPVLQIYTFREIAELGELDPERAVIIGGIIGDLEDGGQVVLSRQRWALRPGDVVRVGLRGEETPAGFYVPENAIQYDGSRYHVAVVKDTREGTQQVEFASVTPGEIVGSMRRIDGELKAGMKVIVEGAHYVSDGDLVRTVQEVAAQ